MLTILYIGRFNPHAVVDDGKITEGMHNVIDTISHPNQFFELSCGNATASANGNKEN